MEIKPKLATAAACRVAGLDSDRFNEAVAAGFFTCAPKTSPGRPRYFDPDDMIALRLYRENIDSGLSKKVSGKMACEVAQCARDNPDAPAISFVFSYFGNDHGSATPFENVPDPANWDTELFGENDIRKVETFNIRKMRNMLAHYTEEERQKIGEAG